MEMDLDDYRTPYYEGEESFSHLYSITKHMQEVEFVASWIEQYYKKHPDEFKDMDVHLFLPQKGVDDGDIPAWKDPAQAFPATKESVARMRKLVDVTTLHPVHEAPRKFAFLTSDILPRTFHARRKSSKQFAETQR